MVSSLKNPKTFGRLCTPKELKAYLDKYIIRQDAAKRVLATKLCTHLARVNLEAALEEEADERLLAEEKSNMLFIGPTGSGKTRIISLATGYLQIPLAVDDATKFTASGYIGAKVENLVRTLYYQAKGDIAAAERGIIYVDEVDKIASSGKFGRDVNGRQVQESLLALMQGTKVRLKESHEVVKVDDIRVDTSRILYIMGGAFQQLDRIRAERLKVGKIGFRQAVAVEEEGMILKDLETYGMDIQFLGRFPAITQLHSLSENDLYSILRLPLNPLIRAKKREFRGWDVALEFTDSAYKALAKRAILFNSGARSLKTVVDAVLEPFQYELPEHKGCPPLVVDRSTVENPDKFLEKYLDSIARKRIKRVEPTSSSSSVWVMTTDDGIGGELEREISNPIEQFEKSIRDYKSDLYDHTALPQRYIDAAASYGLKEGKLIAEVVDDIDRMQKEFSTFAVYYREEIGISLRFKPAFRQAVVCEALQNGSDVLEVLTQRFKPLLDLALSRKGVVEKYSERDLWIRENAYYSSERFFDEL